MNIAFTPLETLGLLAFLRDHVSILPHCLEDVPSKLAASLEANAEMLSLADFGLSSPVRCHLSAYEITQLFSLASDKQ